MYELKKIGKVFTSKFVGTGPSSYEKRMYRAAVSQTLRITDLDILIHIRADVRLHLVIYVAHVACKSDGNIYRFRYFGVVLSKEYVMSQGPYSVTVMLNFLQAYWVRLQGL
jgi:hypothetical protein